MAPKRKTIKWLADRRADLLADLADVDAEIARRAGETDDPPAAPAASPVDPQLPSV